MELPDEADLSIAKGGSLAWGESRHIDWGADYRSRSWSIQSAQDMQKRAFSRAGLAHDGYHFAGFDLEV